MDINNPVIKLCVAGTQAEFKGQIQEAYALYQQAWDAACDDYEVCIAAHYMARNQTEPQQILFWNQEALKHADRVGDERVKVFYPSLYLNMGRAYELLGNGIEAKKYYDLAAELGMKHEMG